MKIYLAGSGFGYLKSAAKVGARHVLQSFEELQKWEEKTTRPEKSKRKTGRKRTR